MKNLFIFLVSISLIANPICFAANASMSQNTTNTSISYLAPYNTIGDALLVAKMALPKEAAYINSLIAENGQEKIPSIVFSENSVSIKGLPYQIKIVSTENLELSYNGKNFKLPAQGSLQMTLKAFEQAIQVGTAQNSKFNLLFPKAHALGPAALVILAYLGIGALFYGSCQGTKAYYKAQGSCPGSTVVAWPLYSIHASIYGTTDVHCHAEDVELIKKDGPKVLLKKEQLQSVMKQKGDSSKETAIRNILTNLYEICYERKISSPQEAAKEFNAKIQTHFASLKTSSPMRASPPEAPQDAPVRVNH